MTDVSIFETMSSMDSAMRFSKIGDEITTAAPPSVGNFDCYVVTAGAGDVGFYHAFRVPSTYNSAPLIVPVGILDGAPGPADTLGFGARCKITDIGEASDGTFAAENVANITIGSNGEGHSDEDEYEDEISVTNVTPAKGKIMRCYVYLDDSNTTYGGNFLWWDTRFRWTA